VRREELPPAVRLYAERALLGDGPLPGLVRFTQSGRMQLKPGRWLDFEAEQEVRVDRVEFAWRARVSFAPLVVIRALDWYREGEGGLEARLFGLIPVARASGPETARSEAMRYLAELPWVPHAILGNGELEWRELDPGSVEVATPVGLGRPAVTLHFDEAGHIVRASAHDRPSQEGKRLVERPWFGDFGDYRELAGVRVPTAAEVAWELPDGPFTYFKGRLTSLEVE
jgi:hypothetical protein